MIMDVLAQIAGAVLEVIVLLLLAGAALSLRMMVRGYGLLRRSTADGLARDDNAILLKSPLTPAISVIATVPDASAQSLSFVHNLLKLHYGDHEVVLVLDGPDASEMAVWTTEFGVYRSARPWTGALPTRPVIDIYAAPEPVRLTIVAKERGGRADCFNAGLNLAGAPLVALADERSIIELDALLRLVRPLMADPEATVAVCGVAPPAQASTRLERIHLLETVRVWLGRYAGLADHDVLLPVAGSLCIIRRQVLLDSGGLRSSLLEAVLHLHASYRSRNKPYRIHLVPEPVATPRPPATFAEMAERTAEEQEKVEAYHRSRELLWKHGSLGNVALPWLAWEGALRPLMELAAWALALVCLVLGSWYTAAAVPVVICGIGALHSITALALRERVVPNAAPPGDLAALFVAAIMENLWYRQARNLRLASFLLRRPATPRLLETSLQNTNREDPAARSLAVH